MVIDQPLFIVMLLNKECSLSKHHVFLYANENTQISWSRADSMV